MGAQRSDVGLPALAAGDGWQAAAAVALIAAKAEAASVHAAARRAAQALVRVRAEAFRFAGVHAQHLRRSACNGQSFS